MKSTETLAQQAFLKKQRRRRLFVAACRVFLLLFLLILWESCARIGIIDDFIFSSPSRVAESLISMTDISGILRDKDDPNTLIGEITIEEAQQLIESGIVAGGMIPKVECCINAIQWGVNRVFIIDGRISHGILMETLTDEGIGTMFIKGEKTP